MEKNKRMEFSANTFNFISDKNPAFYKYYPKLFQSYFNYSDEAIIDSLCSAGYLYYQSILFTDKVIDDKDFSVFPKISICQEEAIKILSSIYQSTSSFWNYWNLRRSEYYFAVKQEKKIGLSASVKFKDYKDIADKKSAFGKVAIDSLYALTDSTKKDLYERLILSHRYFSIGFQLYDDVKDFFEDYNKKQFNWGLYSLKDDLTIDENSLPISVKHKLFYLRGTAQKILNKAILFFTKALLLAKGTSGNNNEWTNTIQEMIITIKKYIDITNGYLESLIIKEKVRRQTQSGQFFSIDEVGIEHVVYGLDFVKNSFLQNYSELKHYMYLGKWDGVSNKTDIHVSDTFQRALINDCLVSVANKYNLNINAYIQDEINYLLCRIQKDGIGGWSYFPSVEQIAADIDDLGQIVQLFVNTKRLDLIDAYCLKPIRIAITERVHSNGGIETWIIPRQYKTKVQKIQEHFNLSKWGTGPDVEVVANFIYSLLMLNKKEYAQCIAHSLQFIAQNQNRDGFWDSRWYYGKYYGTYVCLRLLFYFRTKELKHIKNKAIKFICKSQLADGGFGLNETSDALNTSLALMTLKMFRSQKVVRSIDHATEFLLKVQQPDGSWKGVDFIKPKANEPYKSTTLTTAIALKALSI